MVDTELFERDLAPRPVAQFERWYRDALAANAVEPESIEFWQGRPNRLHDRLRYTRDVDGSWRIERLAP